MEETLQPLLELLKKTTMPKNSQRTNSGLGRSQCFGIVNRRLRGIGEGVNNYKYPKIYAELRRLSKILAPENNYTTFTVNVNYEAKTHIDKYNDGVSTTVAFGDFTGGELVFGGEAHSTRYNPITFGAYNTPHSVNPSQGDRYSIVMYRPKFTKEFQASYKDYTIEQIEALLEKPTKGRPASVIRLMLEEKKTKTE